MPIATIQRMDDRIKTVAAAMKAYAGFSSRVLNRSVKHYKTQPECDLKKGILTLVSAGEGDYNQGLGMVALDGTHRLLIIGQLKTNDEPAAVEDMELAMIEEIKTFVRTGVEGMDLVVDNVQHSRQQAAPFGWLVVYLDAKPQRNSLY